MEMHILELPKLPPEQKSETDLMQWMRFLNGKRREDFEKMAKKNSCFEEAYKELDKLSADEKKRLEYEARQKAIIAITFSYLFRIHLTQIINCTIRPIIIINHLHLKRNYCSYIKQASR